MEFQRDVTLAETDPQIKVKMLWAKVLKLLMRLNQATTVAEEWAML